MVFNNRSMLKIAVYLASLLLLLFTVNSIANAAKDDSIKITKEDAVLMAVKNSNIIRDMNHSLEDMVRDYGDMNDRMSMLRGLYDLLPRYSNLYNKRTYTNSDSDYKRYLELQQHMVIDQPRLVEIEAELAVLNAIPSPSPEELNEINTLEAEKTEINNRINELAVLEGTLTNEEKAGIMTIEEDYELQMVEPQFSLMGITSPNLSRKEEYETFVYPLEVAPYAMQTGISSMVIGVETAEAGVISGAVQLYDTLLDMHGFYELQVEGNRLKEDQLNEISNKFKQGKASKVELTKAYNDWRISSLEKAKMERDIENLEMTFKQMLGLNLSKRINLHDLDNGDGQLKDLDHYIEEALNNRSEIQTIELSISSAKYELEKVKDYFSKTSDSYIIAESKLKEKELELLETKIELEKEIREAYMDVKNKKQDMNLKEKELNKTINEQMELQHLIDMGFATKTAGDSFQMMIIQKVKEYDSAMRDYKSALDAIAKASKIGPSYFGMEGGIGFE